MKADYEAIGLKVGLECHQQLATGEKLFCACKPELFKEEPEMTFLRRLRPTQSELGQVDPAALFEFQKGVRILYEADKETSCLVEMDEEPPHELNPEALEIALTVALMMGSKPIEEVHVMRKIVIDGSNTTGFQRTCVVALNGEVKVDSKKIPIEHVSLEEDAARKTGTKGFTVFYRVDRLCVPLVEVATAPVIHTPQEAEKVALAIGRVMRATGRVRRGLGTIRQDLNISTRDGALIEIKGVQELELVAIFARLIEVYRSHGEGFLFLLHGQVAFPAWPHDQAVAQEGISILLPYPVGGNDETRVLESAGIVISTPFFFVGLFPVRAKANQFRTLQSQAARRLREGDVPSHQYPHWPKRGFGNHIAKSWAES